MNDVTLKGRITSDIELRTTSSGVEYCSFTVAVDRYTKQDSEKITDFIPCKAWRKTAVFISTYFGKGKEILLKGNVYIDKYEKDGEKRTFTYVNVEKVEFCGSKNSNESTQSNYSDVQVFDDGDVPF